MPMPNSAADEYSLLHDSRVFSWSFSWACRCSSCSSCCRMLSSSSRFLLAGDNGSKLSIRIIESIAHLAASTLH